MPRATPIVITPTLPAYGLTEVAEAADVQPGYVRTIHARSQRNREDGVTQAGDLPVPTWDLRAGPVWVGPAIEAWISAKRDPDTMSLAAAAAMLGTTVAKLRADIDAGRRGGVRQGAGWRMRRDVVERQADRAAHVSEARLLARIGR